MSNPALFIVIPGQPGVVFPGDGGRRMGRAEVAFPDDAPRLIVFSFDAGIARGVQCGLSQDAQIALLYDLALFVVFPRKTRIAGRHDDQLTFQTVIHFL